MFYRGDECGSTSVCHRQKDFSLQCCSYTYTWGNSSVQCCLNFQLILRWLLHLRSSSGHGPRCCLNRVLNKCTGQAGVAGWTMSWMWWTSAIHSMAESTRHLKWIWAANGCQQRVRSGCGWCGRTVWTRICATFQVSWLKTLGLVVKLLFPFLMQRSGPSLVSFLFNLFASSIMLIEAAEHGYIACLASSSSCMTLPPPFQSYFILLF